MNELLPNLPDEVEAVATNVIGCAIEVHRQLGPGLLEKIYQQALCHELRAAGLFVEQQVEIVIPYKNTLLNGQILDLMVEKLIVIEIKAVSHIMEVHAAQLLTYLHCSDRPLGFLFNFHALTLKAGMRRIINPRWSKRVQAT